MSIEISNVLVPDERIMDKIYLMRDQKVMLDRDLPLVTENTPIYDRKAIELKIMSDIVIEYEEIHFPVGNVTLTDVVKMRLEQEAMSQRDFAKKNRSITLFYVVIQIFGVLFFLKIYPAFLIILIQRLLPLFFVKTKRKRALLGSNLTAILFTDTRQRGGFQVFLFFCRHPL